MLYMYVNLGFPQPPIITVSNYVFCFAPVSPTILEHYEVNLADSTSLLTRLSGIFSTSRCLAITSDLYPDVCGPFHLSVTAINTVGRVTTHSTILSDAESRPCDCYQQTGTDIHHHAIIIMELSQALQSESVLSGSIQLNLALTAKKEMETPRIFFCLMMQKKSPEWLCCHVTQPHY